MPVLSHSVSRIGLSGINHTADYPEFTTDTQQYDFFSYSQNTTMCNDGTVCMNPGNNSCCDQGNGKHEIHYYNNAAIPTGVAQLNFYYANGDYGGTSGVRSVHPPASVTLSGTNSGATPPLATTTGIVPVSSSTTAPNRQSKKYVQGVRVGIGVGIGASLGTILIALILFLIWRRHKKRIPAVRRMAGDGKLSKRSEPESDWLREMDTPRPLKHIYHVQEMPAMMLPEMQTLTPTISREDEAEKFL